MLCLRLFAASIYVWECIELSIVLHGPMAFIIELKPGICLVDILRNSYTYYAIKISDQTFE